MKTTELRIGNYVKLFLNHSDYNVIQIRIDDLYYINQKNGVYEPILLTEEWLEKFGFEHNEKLDLYQIKNSSFISLCKNKTKEYWTDYESYYGLSYLEIIYVHQLQNLYFALTGEELKLN